MKRVLLIGGGKFLGYWTAKLLSESGFELTFFNLGNSNNSEFSSFEHIKGNRRDPHFKEFFKKNFFDVVIDFCAYSPIDLVNSRYINCNHYVLISSVAVYSPAIKSFCAEDGLKVISKSEIGKLSNEKELSYGMLKYLVELKSIEIFENLLTLRPAIILGHKDYTNRLSKYLEFSDNQILLPDIKDMPFQYIDVKDVAKFIELAISKKFIGEFNLVAKSLSRDCFFEILAEVHAKIIVYTKSYKISDYPLHENELNSGIRTLSSDKALQHGLLVSPIHKTLSYY